MPTRFIDLTHPLLDGGPSWPGDPGISVAPHCTLERDGCRVSRVSMGSHQGTHLDAPSHFLPEGCDIDGMTLEPFFGPARLLRIPKGRGEALDLPDLLPFEALIRPGARILYHTGWGENWGREGFFTEGPCLTLDAARFLASRRIALLGMDTSTPAADNAQAVHEVLLGAGVVIVEGLANLGLCPDSFTLSAFPLALAGADGSPIRAVAIC
jgi:kynurenine formamidase